MFKNSPHKFRSVLLYLLLLALLTGFSAPPIGGQSRPQEGEPPADPFGVWIQGGPLRGGPQMKAVGVRWIVPYLDWSDVEKSPGVYDWSRWDAILGDAAAKDFWSVATIVGNPTWAAATVCGPLYPNHLSTFADFVAAAVERYSQPPYQVAYWAFYNEPDNSDAVNFAWLHGCWGRGDPQDPNPNRAPGASGAAYADLMRHLYPVVKAADPDARVALGALAYDLFLGIDGGGIFDPYFLDDFLEAGGASYIDVLSFHYYEDFSYRWQDQDNDTSYDRGIVYKARWLQNEVQRVAGVIKPIIVTEVGYPSINNEGEPRQDLQARYLIRIFARAMSEHIHPIIWFPGVDIWPEKQLGLLDTNLIPKQAYYALQTLTGEMHGAEFVRTRSDLPRRFEGYEFMVNGRTKTVIWETGGEAIELPMAVSQAGGVLRVVQGDGVQHFLTDGGAGDSDGTANGVIPVPLTQNPQFIEDLSMPAYTATPTPAPTHTPSPIGTATPTPTLSPTVDPNATATPSPTVTPTPTQVYLPIFLR